MILFILVTYKNYHPKFGTILESKALQKSIVSKNVKIKSFSPNVLSFYNRPFFSRVHTKNTLLGMSKVRARSIFTLVVPYVKTSQIQNPAIFWDWCKRPKSLILGNLLKNGHVWAETLERRLNPALCVLQTYFRISL